MSIKKRNRFLCINLCPANLLNQFISSNSFLFVKSLGIPIQSIIHFSHSVMSDSLRRHGLQHARLPCPSPTPEACSNSCPSSWWCYPTILSSVVTFFSCLQSFPASGSFPTSQFFTSGGQSIAALASLLPMSIVSSTYDDRFTSFLSN